MKKESYNLYELGEFTRDNYEVRAELIIPNDEILETAHHITRKFDTLEEANELFNNETKVLDLLNGKDGNYVSKYRHLYFDKKNRKLDYVEIPFEGRLTVVKDKDSISRVLVDKYFDEDGNAYKLNVKYKFNQNTNQSNIQSIGTYTESNNSYEKEYVIEYKKGRPKYIKELFKGRTEISKDSYRYNDNKWVENITHFKYKEIKSRTRVQYTENYEKPLYSIRESAKGMVIEVSKYIYFNDGSYMVITKEKCTGII